MPVDNGDGVGPAIAPLVTLTVGVGLPVTRGRSVDDGVGVGVAKAVPFGVAPTLVPTRIREADSNITAKSRMLFDLIYLFPNRESAFSE